MSSSTIFPKKNTMHSHAQKYTVYVCIYVNLIVMLRELRVALITPLLKNENRYEPGNYRPVSFTCIPCKVLEIYSKESCWNTRLGLKP